MLPSKSRRGSGHGACRPFHHAGVRRDTLRERHFRAARALRPSLSPARGARLCPGGRALRGDFLQATSRARAGAGARVPEAGPRR
jgi:hypothetical protein